MRAVCATTLVRPSVSAMTAPPKNHTSSVCISVYSESKPMIDGVRMRFCVTVWKTTVPTPWAKAATAMAPTIVARRGRAKSKEPRTNRVRKQAIATTSTMLRTISRVRAEASEPARTVGWAGPACRSRTDMPALPHDEADEHDGAHGPEDHRGGDLHGGDDDAPDEVAGHEQPDAEHRHPGQGPAHVVAHDHRDDVGHDEPEEGDEADDDARHAGGQRDHRGAGDDDVLVAQPHAGGHVLAEAGEGEAAGHDVGEDGDDDHRPQRLVEAAHDAGEAARAPGGHRLQEVEVPGEESGDGPDDGAEHDAHERDDDRGAHRRPAQHAEEDHGAEAGEGGGDEHLDRRRGAFAFLGTMIFLGVLRRVAVPR